MRLADEPEFLYGQGNRSAPKGGWAPGRYHRTCYECKGHYLGDKRSIQCFACAYPESFRYQTPPPLPKP